MGGKHPVKHTTCTGPVTVKIKCTTHGIALSCDTSPLRAIVIVM